MKYLLMLLFQNKAELVDNATMNPVHRHIIIIRLYMSVISLVRMLFCIHESRVNK